MSLLDENPSMRHENSGLAWPRHLLLILFVAAAGPLSCGEPASSSGGPSAADLAAYGTSYLQRRGQEPRPNALGEPVRFEDFAGRFLWVEYAAPWCGPCDRQAGEAKAFKLRAPQGELSLLTVMTSEMGGYGHPATIATAKAWAQKHGLPAAAVLAADLTHKTVPEHILFSPEGHTLFIRQGLLSAEEMERLFLEHKGKWEER